MGVNLSSDQVPDLKWLSKFGNPSKASSLGKSVDADPTTEEEGRGMERRGEERGGKERRGEQRRGQERRGGKERRRPIHFI